MPPISGTHVKTQTNLVENLEQKVTSQLLSTSFSTLANKASQKMETNSLLSDDKLLKSLENSLFSSSRSLENPLLAQPPAAKFTGKFDFTTNSTNFGGFLQSKFSTQSSCLLENSLLKNNLSENRLLNGNDSTILSAKLTDATCLLSKISRPSLSLTKKCSTEAAAFEFQSSTKFADTEFRISDSSTTEIRNKRKATTTTVEPSIVYEDEVIDQYFDFGPSPSKQPKRGLQIDETFKRQKADLSEEILEIRRFKLQFINCIAGSLINSPKFFSISDKTREEIIQLADRVVDVDPEFVLKVALYTRCDLNIRTTANFLLAYASLKPPCRRFLKKYYSATIRLPSDWIEVVDLYASLLPKQLNPKKVCPLPNALRQVMVEKFSDFDQYQLAKHNKNKKTNKGKKMQAQVEQKRARRAGQTKDLREKLLSKKNQDCGDDEDDNDDLGLVSSFETGNEKQSKLNLKKLIRQLHIMKPAEYVMGILGKRYPKDLLTFQRSGLLGHWNESRAGKRMKLAIPETWETQIAGRGNKPEVWQDLLDHRKLPYMAMLRNLRNIIKSGVDEKYHKMILDRLQNENQVANSKQFPFRFFSAYHALDELIGEFGKRIEFMAKASSAQGGKVRVPTKAVKKGKVVEWWVRKKQLKLIRGNIHYDELLVNRYRKALDNAVRIATIRNVKPIRGRTVVFCDVREQMSNTPCSSAKGLGKPRTCEEIGILLALMCSYVCENSQLYLFTDNCIAEVNFIKSTILENMQPILEEAEKLRSESMCLDLPENDVNRSKLLMRLRSYLVDRTKIDNILIVSGSHANSEMEKSSIISMLYQYRRLVNRDTLYVNLQLAGGGIEAQAPTSKDDRNVYLRGYSDQILRYLAERGSGDQLNHVEHIDIGYDLQVTVDKKLLIPFKPFYDQALFRTKTDDNLPPRTLRVFVSSTFLDMQSERNVLLRYVFPELQRRARDRYSVDILPIDLRWGITETQSCSHDSINLCLQQVSKCQLFVGLLGQRYGNRVTDYAKIVDELGQPYQWLTSYPKAASITELEIFEFALSDPDKARKRAFFYFRDETLMGGLPAQFIPLMTETDPSAIERLKMLKTTIVDSGLDVYENYPWKLNGLKDGFPNLIGLQAFAQHTLNDLWSALVDIYDKHKFQASDMDDVCAQWKFVESECENFVGREKVTKTVCTTLKKHTSGLFLLVSKGALGKTSFMASLAQIIRDNENIHGSPILCFRDALIGRDNANPAGVLFRFLSICSGQPITSFNNEISPTAWSQLLEHLTECSYRLTFLIDGFDSSQIEWLFDVKLENVKFIVSVNENSALEQSIVRRKLDFTKLELPELDIGDQTKLVRNVLSVYGKSLDENAFSNQMRILLSKRDSYSPAYLHLACEELRLFGSFENLNSTLRSMSSNMSGLIRDVLKQIETEHEQRLLEIILFLVVLFDGELTQQDLYSLTATAMSFTKLADISYSSVVYQYDKRLQEPDILPYSLFMFVYNVLSSTLIYELRSAGDQSEKLLNIRFHEVSLVVRKFYVKNPRILSALKIIYAAFLHHSCDPLMDGMFPGCIGRHFSLLPSALASVGEWWELYFIVKNVMYIERCFHLRAFVDFSKFFILLREHALSRKQRSSKSEYIYNISSLDDIERFIMEKASLLYKYPSLTCQEVNNQPKCSSVTKWLEENLRDKIESNSKTINWINKPDTFSCCYRTSAIENISCVTVSADNRFVAAGCVDGRVFLVDYSTGKEIHTFLGHSDSVTDVRFLDDYGCTLASCSSGGAIFVWNTKLMVKIATLTNHSGYVSMCRPFKWGKVINLISVGWDSTIRLWNYLKSKEIDCIKDKMLCNPVNCLDCHPTDPKIVAGLWSNILVVYSIAPIERKAVLRGHLSSVRAVAYHPNGLFIISAAMDGEVKLWSSVFAAQVGSFLGHSGPVTKLMYSNDSLITAAEDSLLKVWSPLVGVPICSIEAPADQLAATAVAMHADGESFAVGYNSNRILYISIDVLSNKINTVWSYDCTSSVKRLKFIPSKQALLVVHRQCALILALDTGSLLKTLKNDEAFLTSGDINESVAVVSHENGVLSVYDVSTAYEKRQVQNEQRVERVLQAHTGCVTGCSLSPGGQQVVSVGLDRNLFIWNLNPDIGQSANYLSEPVLAAYNCHTDGITCVAWSDKKEILVTGSRDCSLKVWNAANLKLLTTFQAHKAPISAVSVQRGCVASASDDGIVTLWSSSKGVLVNQLKDDTATSRPCSVDLLLKPRKETDSWAEIVMQEEEDEAIANSKTDKLSQGFTSIDFDQALLIASFSSGFARLWKPFLGHSKMTLSSHVLPVVGIASASASSERFVSAGMDGLCKFWSLPTDNLETFACRVVHDGHVTCGALCPTEAYFATGGRDGKCVIFTTKESVDTIWMSFMAHEKSISSMVWILTKNGDTFLITSGEDCHVKMWAVDFLSRQTNCVSTFTLDYPVSHLAYNGVDLYVATWSSEILAINPFDKSATATFVRHNAPRGFFKFRQIVQSRGKWITSMEINKNHDLVVGCAESNPGLLADSITVCPFVSFATVFGLTAKHATVGILCADSGLLKLCNFDTDEKLAEFQAHNERITCARVLELPRKGHSWDQCVYCTVSLDRTLKIWQGTSLIGLWESPAALNFVEFYPKNGYLYCGDVLGCVYCLRI